MRALTRALGERAIQPRFRRLAGAWFGRDFSRREAVRVAVLYEPTRIAFAQAYPFAHYAPELHARHGAEVRLIPRADAIRGLRARPADIVLLQTLFKRMDEDLEPVFDAIRAWSPNALIAFLDSSAHTDLRLARKVAPHVAFYLKKAIFKDRSLYERAFCGDTNLTEYYSELYGLDAEPTDWRTPPEVLDKLRPAPNFPLAPKLIGGFGRREGPPPQTGRTLDVHARLAEDGSPWYARMRRDCVARIERIPDCSAALGIGVPWPRFMAEMRNAKLCASPFGYGEICWRDIEAFQTGSVLVKPNMDHLETTPAVYRASETYVSTRWDLSDLEEKVLGALSDLDMRAEMAERAYALVADYIADARFVDDMAFLFS